VGENRLYDMIFTPVGQLPLSWLAPKL